MKEIFDWMREQMLKRKSAWEEDSVADKVSAEKHIGTWNVALRILEKAEAKWKEDCCEWQYNEFEEMWETSCGVLLNPNSNDREVTYYCCSCGKCIKIAEVE